MEYHGFAVGLPQPGKPHREVFERLVDLVQVADDTGLDAWYFAEHHHPHVVPSGNLMLAITGWLTRRIRLGVMVTILPYHHPVRAVEEIRMLDQIMKGRLDIGFGRGALAIEQAVFNVDRATTAARLDQSIDVVLQLLTYGKGEFESEWWQGKVEGIAPDPIQTPYPRMWVSAVSGASIERAAHIGANVATTLPFDTALERRTTYQEAWAQARPGEEVGKFSHGVTLAIAETRAEAEKTARHLLDAQFKRLSSRFASIKTADDPSYADHARGIEAFTNVTFDEYVDRGMLIYGSVEDAVEQLRPMVESGMDVVHIRPEFGAPHEFERRSVELFATEVIPKADPSRSVIDYSVGS